MDLIIHVGFRKTATSWLQDVLFPSLSVNYIAKTKINYPEWLIEWHYADDFYFEQRADRIKTILSGCLDRKRPNLLSSEAFTNTGVIHSQAYRIKKIWPNARILVTIRNPVAMVWSHYRADIQEGDCFVDLEHWLDWSRTPFVLHKRKPIYLPDFFFDESISLYRHLFGPKNVCVLKYEDMHSQNKDDYFYSLFNFLKIRDELPSEELLLTKVNEGPVEKESLEKMKRKNLEDFIYKNFPCLQLSKEADFFFDKMTNDTIRTELSKDIRERLISYFRRKSYDYYQ